MTAIEHPSPSTPSTSADRVIWVMQAAGYGIAAVVPDAGLQPLIARLPHSEMTYIASTREDEAVAIAAGGYLGGKAGVVLMQSSGLGNCANVFASLIEYYEIPVLLLVSRRGGDGEHIAAQIPFGRRVDKFLDLFGFEVRTPKLLDNLIRDVGLPLGRRAIVAAPREWMSMLSVAL